MSDCVFCKIMRGELPSARVFENGEILAFLDIAPVAHGHTLVVPKKHYENVLEIPPAELASLASQLPRLARAMVKATGAEGFSIVQLNGACAGQVVMHLHFHLIPRKSGDGVRFGWPKTQYGDGQMARLAEQIAREIKTQ